jgi:ParB-like chromosome segregation protein Spo0J
MKFHEYANIYRMLPDIELANLAEDIKEKGQLLPITIYDGKVLDGRNRYRACIMAGVDPRTEEYTGDDPLGLIASLNDHRRHDIPEERAMVGARMANLRAGNPKFGNAISSTETIAPQVITIERAAELSGSSPANIKRAKPIVQSGIQELQDMVSSGDVSIRAASEVAKLTKEEQRKAVMGGVDGVKKAAKNAKDSAPPKVKRKPAIPSKEDIAKDHQRILGQLKSSWAAAPTAIRNEFLAWVEKTKNTTNA